MADPSAHTLDSLREHATAVSDRTGLGVTVEPFEGQYALTVTRPDGMTRHSGYSAETVHGMLCGAAATAPSPLAVKVDAALADGRREPVEDTIRLEGALHLLRFALDRFIRAEFKPAPEYLRDLLDRVTDDPGEPCDRARQYARAEAAEAALRRVAGFLTDIDTPDWRAPGPEVALRIRSLIADGRDDAPRLLDCGWCYEEQGEEVHPHPECPIGQVVSPAIVFAGAEVLPLKGSPSPTRIVLSGDEHARFTVEGIRYATSTEHPVVVEPFGPGAGGGLVTLTLIASKVEINGKEATDV